MEQMDLYVCPYSLLEMPGINSMFQFFQDMSEAAPPYSPTDKSTVSASAAGGGAAAGAAGVAGLESEKSIAHTSPFNTAHKFKGVPTSPSDSSPTSAKSPVSGATPGNSDADQLRTQLAEAQTQIERLKERLSEQGLRQRKVGGDLATAPTPTVQSQQAAEAGVPIQFVASLCLLSFLLAYFFF